MKSEDNIRRIFVSIPIPQKIREDILRFREANQSVKRLIWTKESNLHITVYFIGNIKQEFFSSVTEIVRDIVAEQASFELNFESISLAPLEKKPRMIWLRFSRNELFTDLATRIHLSLRKFIPENPFYVLEPIPHITLTRFNSTFDTSNLKLALPLEISDLKVGHCELWESIPTSKGVQYVSLERFPMR